MLPNPTTGAAVGSASPSEKHATPTTTTTTNSPPAAPKLRSCVICRRRKVRCDKTSPCSNCRRANIACVFPSNDRPPRWARRLERLSQLEGTSPAPSSDTRPTEGLGGQNSHVIDRLRNLEGLVKELSSQLEQANASANPSGAGGGSTATSVSHSSPHSPDDSRDPDSSSNTGTSALNGSLGRMVLKDANRGRYISSGFWARVDLSGLKMDLAGDDYGSSEDEFPATKSSTTQELDRTPSDRHGFVFKHNQGVPLPDSREFHPLASQIPFLLDAYAENVNLCAQIVHMPTAIQMTRHVRGGNLASLTPANEALVMAMCYAAVTSMEEDDVVDNFGQSKGELNIKYRIGFECALAKADFLNVPDITLVQAFAIFLCLARRHDSPRFIWMNVGLLIRAAQALGLHRDGSHFPHLTPYEVELRRRLWWAVCVLDIRASEDQGTEYTIPAGSFDTRLPLNINDADIHPDGTQGKEPLQERDELTDMTFALDMYKVCEVTRRIMAPGARPSLPEQARLLAELHATLERGYLRHSPPDSSHSLKRWAASTAIRLTTSKMTLMVHYPLLSTAAEAPQQQLATRDRLLVAAIEVAEWNHALNAESACRQWRWLFQTYTHWPSVFVLLSEIGRRALTPTVERAWVALHSCWLIPARAEGKELQIWIPLRKLMVRARRQRKAELLRLRDMGRENLWEMREEGGMPVPASRGVFGSVEGFREHWLKLVTEPEKPVGIKETPGHLEQHHNQPGVFPSTGPSSYSASSSGVQGDSHGSPDHTMTNQYPMTSQEDNRTESRNGLPDSLPLQLPADWTGGQGMDAIGMPWLMDPAADGLSGVDVDMDADNDIDWLTWLESAKNMDAHPGMG